MIFVDEAAHLNTFQIAMLDAYADKVGGTLFLASDSN
nr:MAG TPA: PhoH-like protein [Bacteriophage sp.]